MAMDPERLRQIEELYHQACERTPDEREGFLNAACANDAELLRDVLPLLAQDPGVGPMEQPILQVAASLLSDSPAAHWTPGTQVGPYQIVSRLGEGGMGEVFKARDTRLGREVAIKTAHEEFSGRFQREARAISSLNHPNVCTLHDVGPNYLVMELVEGADLAGPVPIDTSIGYARQIAAGLEAAHERGIVHRDLKPANIKVTPEGTVKILDFGLAKATEAPTSAAGAASPTMSPTLSVAMTEKGMILGTAAYMSPEQARGEPVDRRSDIWAFGVILYELLTGKMLFGDSKNVSDVLAAVLTREPNFSALPKGTPPRVRRLLELCLRKDPKLRLQAIGDARILLDEPEPEAPVPSAPARRWLWAAGFATLSVLATVAFFHFREKPPAPTVPLRFQIPAPENTTGQASGTFNLSPDGRKLAFIAGGRLWVHSLESGESRDLTDTTGGVPFWSPDSRFIGYTQEGGADAKLKKIEATGGPPQTVTDLRSNAWGCGAWNQDDVIVFGDRQVGLFRVPASGGVPVQITALDSARHENSQFGLSFLPDGRHFVYFRASTDKGKSAIYLGSVDAKPEQQSSEPLVASNWQPGYAPSADPSIGYLLFVREGTLMAQPFDNRRLELKGQAAPVAEQVDDRTGGAGGWAAFSASANDVLVFRRSAASGRQLTWFDREGKVMGTVGEPGVYGDLELSPDGTRVAVTKGSGADAANIWLLDLSRGGASTRFTFGAAIDTNSVWSPDGSRMIFSSNRDGPYNLYQKPANGVKDEEVLLKSSEDKHATSWSRDGRSLLYTAVHPKTKRDIWVLPLEGDRKPFPFLITEFNERQARFSPDGHWVAYTSDESGRDEVYVRSFSMNSAGTAVEAGGKWPISNGFGQDPRWRGDGRELYYRSRGGGLLAVEVATHPAFRVGAPQALGVLTLAFGSSFGGLAWDSAADGRRFIRPATKSGSEPYTVALNWQAGLKK